MQQHGEVNFNIRLPQTHTISLENRSSFFLFFFCFLERWVNNLNISGYCGDVRTVVDQQWMWTSRPDVRGQKGEAVKKEGGTFFFLCSSAGDLEQKIFQLTVCELSIVSDFIKCVRLHNPAVLEDCVQQVL